MIIQCNGEYAEGDPHQYVVDFDSNNKEEEIYCLVCKRKRKDIYDTKQ